MLKNTFLKSTTGTESSVDMILKCKCEYFSKSHYFIATVAGKKGGKGREGGREEGREEGRKEGREG